jgi:DNA-binding MarR family transcriptional regulator
MLSNYGKTEESFRALIKVYGALSRIMHPYFGQFGISGSQWGVLRNLHSAEHEGRSGLHVLELGDRLLVRPPSVSALVNRLERLGLVVRVMPKTDLRCKEVRLTQIGRDLAEQIFAVHGEQIELIMGGLNATEQRQLLTILNKLSVHLNRIAENQNGNDSFRKASRESNTQRME